MFGDEAGGSLDGERSTACDHDGLCRGKGYDWRRPRKMENIAADGLEADTAQSYGPSPRWIRDGMNSGQGTGQTVRVSGQGL